MPLSGEEMLKRYLRGGWTIVRRRGSHVIVGLGGIRETIPMHPELGRGSSGSCSRDSPPRGDRAA